jgi:hypothetical protein
MQSPPVSQTAVDYRMARDDSGREGYRTARVTMA